MLEQQLNILQYIAQYRTPILDSFFLIIKYADSYHFLCIVTALTWIWISKKEAVSLFIVTLYSATINNALKAFFSVPRPYEIDSAVAIARSFGGSFPSGGSQGIAIVSFFIASYFGTKKAYLLAAGSTLLVGFSRMYLGVHYPADVIVGILIGLVLAFVARAVIPQLNLLLTSTPLLSSIALCVAPLLALLYFSSIQIIVSIAIFFAALTLYIDHKPKDRSPLKKGVITLLILPILLALSLSIPSFPYHFGNWIAVTLIIAALFSLLSVQEYI